MWIALALAAVVAALGAAATVGASPGATVVGVTWRGEHDALVQRFDARTLRPLGAGTRLGIPGWAWSRSPDGARIAFVGERPGQGLSLVVLDAATLRADTAASGPLSLQGVSGGVQSVSWLPGDRLVLLTWDANGESVAHLVDLPTRIAGARVALRGQLLAGRVTPLGFAGLLAPTGRIGSASVVALDRDLHVTRVVLDRIRAGSQSHTASDADVPVATMRTPGLAVDPTGRRAVVVGFGEPVADVDLVAGAVRYHEVPVRLPAKTAKAIDGPQLSAFWLGGGAVAVAGTSYGGMSAAGELRRSPFGLQILDLDTWRLRVSDPDVGWLSSTGSYLVWLRPDRGLRWYGPTGQRRGAMFGTRQVQDFASTRTRALVRLAGATSVAVVDLGTGRVVARRPIRLSTPSLPLFLVGRAAPF